MMKEKIICRVLTGPTASGKSELGLRLAEERGWEICCMDSMQIYRRMDIGTAKPTPEEQRRVRHHLLDICDPKDRFSVAMYRERAAKLIREKWERENRELLFVGGTGLYLQAMMHPMGMGMVSGDETLRAELREISQQPDGKRILHERLSRLDPDSADRLPENDVRRVIRALEVTLISGVPFSKQPPGEETQDILWKAAALWMPRELLYERINRRVDQMIEAGLKEEVQGLLAEGVPPEAQSMQAIGYKEMLLHLNGTWDLARTAEEIRKGTRHYAKRQETFLRREPAARPFDAQSQELMADVMAYLS